MGEAPADVEAEAALAAARVAARVAAEKEVASLARRQDGVVARFQVRGAGLGEHDIRRRLRRREWATVHLGVYVDHTGPLTWRQRAWAAVLIAWPAALCHESAIRAADSADEHGRHAGRDDAPIHVAVDRDRAFRAPAGVVPHRLLDLSGRTQWNASPPRLRIEHAVLDVAAEASDELEAVAIVSDAVRARKTTARRLLEALAPRSRIARRTFLESVLLDVAGRNVLGARARLPRLRRAGPRAPGR